MKIIPKFVIFLIVVSAFANQSTVTSHQTQGALQDGVIKWLRPFRIQIRKWFWNISGVTYNNPFASGGKQQSRASFIDCNVCTQILPFLRGLLETGITESTLVEIINAACLALDLAPEPRICRPIIEKYAKPLTYIFKFKSDIPDNDFCGILNPGCTPISEGLLNWTIRVNSEKPLPIPRPAPPPLGTSLTKIIHFTDLHLDLHYTEGKNAICNLPHCCRVINGEPTNETAKAGKYGDLGCALPSRGLKALYQHVKDNVVDNHPTRFIFLTGDYIHSNTWEYGKQENGMHLGNVSQWLKDTFVDDTSLEIYPLIGNHEPDICNLYPPEFAWENFSLEWMYDAVVQPYKDFLPPRQLSLFRKYGYYTMESKIDRNLRIVVLNTNMCYIDNFWLPTDPIDPFGQLQWLSDTMGLAEKLNQKVFIIGHISPGSNDCWAPWSNQFHRIINRYEALIKGQWYGHEHIQDYKITFEEGSGRPISVSYVDASGLPDGMNPGYNVFYADGERGEESTWEIINQETWILNLTASNALQNDEEPPVFQKILDARGDFNLSSMSPEEIHGLIERMVCNDDLFLKYQKVNVKGEDSPRFAPCGNDTLCKSNALRNLFVANTADFSHRDKLENQIMNGDCSVKDGTGGSGSLILHSSTFTWTTAFLIGFNIISQIGK